MGTRKYAAIVEQKYLWLKPQLDDHTRWLKSGFKKGRRLSLFGHNLTEIELSGLDLSYSSLNGGVNLSKANLREVNLTGAEMSGVNLTDADLTNAILHEVELFRADLTNVDLTKANVRNISISLAILKNTKI